MTRLAALASAGLLAGCALPPPHPGAFSFGVMGDMPYGALEEAAFDAYVDAMNEERLAFVVHVGDFKSSSAPCTDEIYLDRLRRFARSRHPLAFTPGDNDWVDCRRRDAGTWNPLERLARLRALFFAEPQFLGPEAAPAQGVMRECALREGIVCRCHALPENRRWSLPLAGTDRSLSFATLNVQGSNDNVGFDAASDREAACRRQANLRWMQETFAGADARAAAVVLMFHANPFVGRQDVHRELREAIVREAARFARPVLVVHGDTHTYRVDRPFRDASGNAVPNLTRLETFGSPLTGWVMVTVDPSGFRFEPRGDRGQSPN
jgi:hypothetical protein